MTPTPYHKFRTGLTYQEVSGMVWSYSDNPATWPLAHHTRRRHTVLGKWKQLKQEMHREYCEQFEQQPTDLPF